MTADHCADGPALYYIGNNDCKKASCNREQEFPRGDDPYCLIHSLESYFGEGRPQDTGTNREERCDD